MSKLRKQALNYLEIIREAIKLPLSNPRLVLSILLFILFPFNLVIFFISKLNFQIEFITVILQWLNTTFAVSLLSKAYIHKPSSLLLLLSSLQRKWKKIFITAILTGLITFTCSSLFLLLRYHATFTRFMIAILGFCMYMFVHLGCQLSITISSIKESCYGLEAIRRAVEIIGGKKAQSIVLMALMFAFDAVGNAPAAVETLFQLLWCSLYSVLYLENKKRQETEEDMDKWIV